MLNLSQGLRIRKRPEYLVCYEEGRRFASRSFMVFARVCPCDEPGFRFGMAVSKKVGSAVRRNRVKRLIREFFRLRQVGIREGVAKLSAVAGAPVCLEFVCVVKRSARPESMDLAVVDEELWPVVNKVVKTMGKRLGGDPAHRDVQGARRNQPSGN
ncbi:ribonuclease P protein component [Oceanidesulfovibrio marinus]|uniref:Ribonuclease P protein component n=1 Tax=Oceanidesulfovibrio marinus TaxID=370038 RepID=A0A6P1ZLE1_9BACT|nr:ribonuclease P protein component [Oceanidesulfovibrio marinus]